VGLAGEDDRAAAGLETERDNAVFGAFEGEVLVLAEVRSVRTSVLPVSGDVLGLDAAIPGSTRPFGTIELYRLVQLP
jgi:hypothetical protein